MNSILLREIVKLKSGKRKAGKCRPGKSRAGKSATGKCITHALIQFRGDARLINRQLWSTNDGA